jgi:hypothetical protein
MSSEDQTVDSFGRVQYLIFFLLLRFAKRSFGRVQYLNFSYRLLEPGLTLQKRARQIMDVFTVPS